MQCHSTLSKRCTGTAEVVLLTLVGWPVTAHAYIDPNTGGYAFQLLFPIISAIVGIYLFFKNQAAAIGKKILRLFKRNRP
jgi:uncharacterized RDD family membrane protein YckC